MPSCPSMRASAARVASTGETALVRSAVEELGDRHVGDIGVGHVPPPLETLDGGQHSGERAPATTRRRRRPAAAFARRGRACRLARRVAAVPRLLGRVCGMAKFGVGASLNRREDARHLAGRGQFVADLEIPGTLDAAFVRRPARAPPASAASSSRRARRDRVFTAADLPEMAPVRVVPEISGFRGSDYPPLAAGKVRFVGEPVAVCIAASRAEAEDLADATAVAYEELPAVVDAVAALAPGAAIPARGLARQLLRHHHRRGRRHRRRQGRRRPRDRARIPHEPPDRRAAGGTRDPRPMGGAPTRAPGPLLDPVPAPVPRRPRPPAGYP